MRGKLVRRRRRLSENEPEPEQARVPVRVSGTRSVFTGDLGQFGLGSAKTYFYNHHAAHAYGTLFHTDWRDALIYTSDGGGPVQTHSAVIRKVDRPTPLSKLDVFPSPLHLAPTRPPMLAQIPWGRGPFTLHYNVETGLADRSRQDLAEAMYLLTD